MNFATPAAFWWLLLAAPIVLFYILKIRMRRVPVATTMFWQQVFEEKQPRSLWQTLRHWLSLLLQLLFLALLVFAIADPFFSWQENERQRIVLVVDNSASMNATDVSPSRFAEAMTLAESRIDGLRVRDEMAIIAAASQPRVVCGMTGHARTLRDALRTIEPTDGPTNVTAAVELARRLLAGHEQAKVVVLSDAGFDGAEELAKADDVELHTLGENTPNVGITRFQVRRSLLDPVGYQTYIEIGNFSDTEIETQLELNLGDEIVDVIPLTLAAGEMWRKVFEQTASEGGELVASIDYEDALLTDNTARAILPDRPRQPVILVTEGNVFVERVLAANQLVDLTITKEPPESIPPGTIVVYHRIVPEVIPPGDAFILEPTKDSNLWTAGEVIDAPVVGEQEKDHPVLKHVRLENVLMPEAISIVPKQEATALVGTALDEPLILAINRSQQQGGKVLVMTVNLDKGDLPLRTAFPILMTNALAWFAGNLGELREAVSTGAIVSLDRDRLPQSTDGESTTAQWTLTSPSGSESPVSARERGMTLGPFNETGLWTLAVSQSENESDVPSQTIACNLANPRESDLRVTTQGAESPNVRLAGFGSRPIWYYLVILGIVLIAAEWYLYQRRWIT